MFSLEYAEVTRTASGTFHDRQGNCLSFTMLFVALARAVDLYATLSSVDVPPTWSYDGTVVVANHVNTVVRTGGGEETVVDFNIRTVSKRPAQPPRQRLLRARAFLYELGCRSDAERRLLRGARLLARGGRRAPRHRGHLGQSRRACTRATGCTSTRKPRTCARSRSTTTSRRRSRQSRARLRRARRDGARGRVSRARAGLSRAQSLLSLRSGDARLRGAAVRRLRWCRCARRCA